MSKNICNTIHTKKAMNENTFQDKIPLSIELTCEWVGGLYFLSERNAKLATVRRSRMGNNSVRCMGRDCKEMIPKDGPAWCSRLEELHIQSKELYILCTSRCAEKRKKTTVRARVSVWHTSTIIVYNICTTYIVTGEMLIMSRNIYIWWVPWPQSKKFSELLKVSRVQCPILADQEFKQLIQIKLLNKLSFPTLIIDVLK